MRLPSIFVAFLMTALMSLSILGMPLSPIQAKDDFMAIGNTIIIEASEQEVNLATNVSNFRGDVIVTSGETVIRAPRGQVLMNADAKPSTARFEGGVVLTRGKDKMTAPTLVFDFDKDTFKASGGVNTQIYPKGKAPVKITSSTQQYLKSRNQMLAEGNVNVVSEDATATSSQALLVLGADNEAERVTFIGNALLTQKDANVSANKIILLPKQNLFMAEGNAYSRVKQGDSPNPIILRSAYQQLDRNKGLLIASGSVDLDFEDYNAKGPKAVFYMTEGAKMDLKKAVFSGRPTLKEGSIRQVTADTIEITTNPRYFDARGHVKTTLVQEKKKAGTPSKAPTKPNNTAKTTTSQASKKVAKQAVTEEDEFDLGAFDLNADG